MNEWEIIDGVLGIKRADNFAVPTAEEVYSAIFGDVISPCFSDHDIRVLRSTFEFSRYPATLGIVLRPANDRDFIVDLSIQAVAGDGNTATVSWSYNADHIIIDGVWYPWAPGAREEIAGILAAAAVAMPGKIRLRQYLSLIKLKSELIRNEVNAGDLPLVPEDRGGDLPRVKAALYPYQIKGWQWLCFMFREKIGGILADEMGLGKTLQVIALLATQAKEEIFPALIISPATLLENWRREFEKFAPHISTHIHHGSGRTGFPDNLKKYEVVITSYDTVVRDNSLFSGIQWSVMVCDEAQWIKNPETRRAISVKRVPRRAAFAVTGTPVENRLTDLWSLMDFSVPGFLGERGNFESAFENSPDGATRLERLISPLILRRTLAGVAKDLPAKIIIPQVLELSDEEAGLYEQIRLDTLKEFESNVSLVVLTKLRMFCTHPRLLFDTLPDDPAMSSSKYLRLLEIVEEVIENCAKVLVFTSYNGMNDMITADFKRRFGIYTGSIDGRTPIADRQKIVDEFSAVRGGAALVLNPAAAGTGLNITAANHVIHYNLEWNPAREDQASARAYRRGQDRPVTIHRFFYADTVEDIINDRLSRKRELAGTAIVGVQGERDNYDDILKAISKSPKLKK